jgi:predicted aldo/keto reductase-like oxidoreductase
MPCAQGVKIPTVFSLWNEAYRFSDPSSASAQYQRLSPESKASSCIQCHECESKCPQQLPIADLMKEVSDYFEKK